MPVIEQREPDADLDAYTRVRFRYARQAGLTRLEAARFAHGPVPLATLRKLRADGCPAATIARIVCTLVVAPAGALLLESSRVALGL